MNKTIGIILLVCSAISAGGAGAACRVANCLCGAATRRNSRLASHPARRAQIVKPWRGKVYQSIYQAETDFGRTDIYRGLARALGIEPGYRRAQLWCDINRGHF